MWRLDVVYDFHARGQVSTKLTVDLALCDGQRNNLLSLMSPQIEVLWFLDATGRCPIAGETDGGMVALVALVTLASAAQLLRSLVGAGLGTVSFVRALRFQATEAAAVGGVGVAVTREESVPLLTLSSPLTGPRSRTWEVEMSSTTPIPAARSTSDVVDERGKALTRAESQRSLVDGFARPLAPELPSTPLRVIDVLPLLRAWDVLAVACETVLLSYCASVLASAAAGSGVDLSERGWQLPLAVAAAGLWFSTMRFLEYDPLFYAGVVTLEKVCWAPRLVW